MSVQAGQLLGAPGGSLSGPLRPLATEASEFHHAEPGGGSGSVKSSSRSMQVGEFRLLAWDSSGMSETVLFVCCPQRA